MAICHWVKSDIVDILLNFGKSANFSISLYSRNRNYESESGILNTLTPLVDLPAILI